MRTSEKSKTIEVAILGPGKGWVRRTIPHTLESFQEVVGGYLEALSGIQGAVVYVNEDGRDRDLPPSAAWVKRPGMPVSVLLGPILALGPVDQNGLETSLDDDAFSKVKMLIKPLPSAGGV